MLARTPRAPNYARVSLQENNAPPPPKTHTSKRVSCLFSYPPTFRILPRLFTALQLSPPPPPGQQTHLNQKRASARAPKKEKGIDLGHRRSLAGHAHGTRVTLCSSAYLNLLAMPCMIFSFECNLSGGFGEFCRACLGGACQIGGRWECERWFAREKTCHAEENKLVLDEYVESILQSTARP